MCFSTKAFYPFIAQKESHLLLIITQKDLQVDGENKCDKKSPQE